ncbi:DUF6177 family protein, partial [Streptomyces sp. NPDC002521]
EPTWLVVVGSPERPGLATVRISRTEGGRQGRTRPAHSVVHGPHSASVRPADPGGPRRVWVGFTPMGASAKL